MRYVITEISRLRKQTKTAQAAMTLRFKDLVGRTLLYRSLTTPALRPKSKRY